MSVPRTLLVPIDFSEHAEAALDHAIELARKLDAKVHLLSVVDLQGLAAPDLSPTLMNEMIETITRGNQTALQRLADARRASGVVGELFVRRGDPREWICQIAREHHVDLIVMSTHGRRGFRRLVMGSVTETVLRIAPCPVLVVRARGDAAR